MTLLEGLKNYLTGDTGIEALVADRVYPVRLPQKVTLPAITYQLISDPRDPHLRGVTGRARPRFQIDSYALTQLSADVLGGLVRQRLDGFKGEFSDDASPPATITVQGVFFETAMELFDEDINGGSSRHSADYFIHHSTHGGTV